MTIYEKHLEDLRKAYRACREMLAESEKMNRETRELLARYTAQPLDYPRQARVNYTESIDKMMDFPLAKLIRLTTPPQKGAKLPCK